MKKPWYIYVLELYWFSVKLGLRSIFRGIITKESIKRILCPMDPSRYFELPQVIIHLSGMSGRVLDISSPKLVTFYLAEKFPKIIFYATDIFESELNSWKLLVGNLNNIKFCIQDATSLTFKNNYFDYAFSISVIEHINIPDSRGGDSVMINEMRRVLKNNGTLIITTPLGKKHKNNYLGYNIYSKDKKREKTFFYRTYSQMSLSNRIIKASPLKMEKIICCNYRTTFIEKLFNKFQPLSVLFGWILIFVAPFTLHFDKGLKVYKDRADCLLVLKKI